MARRSARIASSQSSQPESSPPAAQNSPPSASKKRKAVPSSGSSPSAKRGKKDDDQKEQISIEESMDLDKKESEQPEQAAETDQDAKPESDSEQEVSEDKQDAPATKQSEASSAEEAGDQTKQQDPTSKPEVEAKVEPTASEVKPAASGNDKADSKEESKEDPKSESKEEPKAEQHATNGEQQKPVTNGDNAVEPSARDEKVPSSILEKGIMYFVYRGRVNIESPDNVQDIARSYLILRPLPHGAKLGDGPIGDDKNCRLIAIPKKMLPVSGQDRWTAFVEKSNLSFAEIKESFVQGENYTVQAGSRHTPAITPAAEGIYAITTTGRESHLAYMLTLPEELGEVQNDLGLRKKGSFVTSVKNPKAPGPANANIGIDPQYPQELQDEFRSLRWMPMKAEHLKYEGCQFLMIGEGEEGIEKATEQQHSGDKNEETPMEEMRKLEDEDEVRVEHLSGDDAIFEDLGTTTKDHKKLETTW